MTGSFFPVAAVCLIATLASCQQVPFHPETKIDVVHGIASQGHHNAKITGDHVPFPSMGKKRSLSTSFSFNITTEEMLGEIGPEGRAAPIVSWYKQNTRLPNCDDRFEEEVIIDYFTSTFTRAYPMYSFVVTNTNNFTSLPFFNNTTNNNTYPEIAIIIGIQESLMTTLRAYGPVVTPEELQRLQTNPLEHRIVNARILSSDGGKSWRCGKNTTTTNSDEKSKENILFLPDGVVRWYAASTTFTYPLNASGILINGTSSFTLDEQENEGDFSRPPSSSSSPGSPHCSLICLLGGYNPSPSALISTTPTASVTCSGDGGATWWKGADLPSPTIRATAVQYGHELLMLGGIRLDGSASIWKAVIGLRTDFIPMGGDKPSSPGANETRCLCNITGWEEYAPAWPMTDRFDVMATTVWNNKTRTLDLWSGGGNSMLGNVPLRALDVWVSGQPWNISSWNKVPGILPVPAEIFASHPSVASLIHLRNRNGKNHWLSPAGGATNGNVGDVCTVATNTTSSGDSDNGTNECAASFLLLNGDMSFYTQQQQQTGILPSAWSTFSSRFVFQDPDPVRLDYFPLHRGGVVLREKDDARSPGAPFVLTFDYGSGYAWRVYTTPCWDKCPPGYSTDGCRFSPYDAVCKPCVSKCNDGFFKSRECGWDGETYGNTVCEKCQYCDPVNIIWACNETFDTNCKFGGGGGLPSKSPKPKPSNELGVSSNSLAFLYVAVLGSALAVIVYTTVPPCWSICKGIVVAGSSSSISTRSSSTIAITSSASPRRSRGIRSSCCSSSSVSFTLTLYMTSAMRSLRCWWPILSTCAHYISYCALATVLWSAPRSRDLAVAVTTCLSLAIPFNLCFLYQTTQGLMVVEMAIGTGGGGGGRDVKDTTGNGNNSTTTTTSNKNTTHKSSNQNTPVLIVPPWSPQTWLEWIAIVAGILHPRATIGIFALPSAISSADCAPSVSYSINQVAITTPQQTASSRLSVSMNPLPTSNYMGSHAHTTNTSVDSSPPPPSVPTSISTHHPHTLSLPLPRYSALLTWDMVAVIFLDAPLLIICFTFFGASWSSPAILSAPIGLCILLGTINLLTTFIEKAQSFINLGSNWKSTLSSIRISGRSDTNKPIKNNDDDVNDTQKIPSNITSSSSATFKSSVVIMNNVFRRNNSTYNGGASISNGALPTIQQSFTTTSLLPLLTMLKNQVEQNSFAFANEAEASEAAVLIEVLNKALHLLSLQKIKNNKIDNNDDNDATSALTRLSSTTRRARIAQITTMSNSNNNFVARSTTPILPVLVARGVNSPPLQDDSDLSESGVLVGNGSSSDDGITSILSSQQRPTASMPAATSTPIAIFSHSETTDRTVLGNPDTVTSTAVSASTLALSTRNISRPAVAMDSIWGAWGIQEVPATTTTTATTATTATISNHMGRNSASFTSSTPPHYHHHLNIIIIIKLPQQVIPPPPLQSLILSMMLMMRKKVALPYHAVLTAELKSAVPTGVKVAPCK